MMFYEPRDIEGVIDALKFLSSFSYTIRDAISLKDSESEFIELVCIEQSTTQLAGGIYELAERLEQLMQSPKGGVQ